MAAKKAKRDERCADCGALRVAHSRIASPAGFWHPNGCTGFVEKRGPGRPPGPPKVALVIRVTPVTLAELDRKRGKLTREQWVEVALETWPDVTAPMRVLREKLTGGSS